MTSPHMDAAQTQLPQSYLYTGLARNHLGETAATVISALISYGRLSARELATKTRLSPRQVRAALVSLIQLNSVQFWTERSGPAAPAVHYAFHAQGMDVLLHAGDIISHVKQHYGAEAAEAVQNVVAHGSITVRDYMALFEDPQTRLDKMAVLMRLYGDGWLRRLQGFELLPMEDLWHQMYTETLRQMPRSVTTSEVKRVAEAKEKTKVRLQDLFASGTDSKDVYCINDGVRLLRPEVLLALHLPRYHKALRTRAFTALANLRMGIVTAHVYAAACALVEQQSPDLGHRFFEVAGLVVDPDEALMLLRLRENALVDSKLTVMAVRDVARSLHARFDVRNSILTQNFLRPGKRALPAGDVPAKKIKLEDGTSAPAPEIPASAADSWDASGADMDADFGAEHADLHSEALVAEHMRLLASSTVPFLVETAPGSYTVPYLQVQRAVKQHHYDALVKTTLGPNALRVLKCVQTMKLVDEKLISNAVLLKDKTVKNEVYKLVTSNVLEIQEVPRSADRAALKTFFLFRHKEAAAHTFLSHSLTFSMAAILRNIDLFKAEHSILLDKCEREDVKGHEEELLLESELKTLRDLQVREIKNIGRFNRIKWLQFVFGCL